MCTSFSFMVVFGLVVILGCSQEKPSAETGEQSGVTQPEQVESVEMAVDSSDDQLMTGTQQDPAADEDVSYEFEELVAKADPNNRGLLKAYRNNEENLAKNPADQEQQLQRIYLLYVAGAEFARMEDPAQMSTAFDTAASMAETFVDAQAEGDISEQYSAVLSQVFFSGARAKAATGNTDAALTAIEKAMAFGWEDLDALQNEPDLAAVRELPAFKSQYEAWAEEIRIRYQEVAQEELAAAESYPFDFALTTISGEEISLADLAGKVAIVDIWGTWCPPCREEIPSFVKLQETYGEAGLQMVGINFEHGDDPEANATLVQDFAAANGINYPCALGSEEIQQQVPNFRGFPTTIFIDRGGKVRLTAVGAHPYPYLEAIVGVLLAEDPSDAAAGPE